MAEWSIQVDPATAAVKGGLACKSAGAFFRSSIIPYGVGHSCRITNLMETCVDCIPVKQHDNLIDIQEIIMLDVSLIVLPFEHK